MLNPTRKCELVLLTCFLAVIAGVDPFPLVDIPNRGQGGVQQRGYGQKTKKQPDSTVLEHGRYPLNTQKSHLGKYHQGILREHAEKKRYSPTYTYRPLWPLKLTLSTTLPPRIGEWLW